MTLAVSVVIPTYHRPDMLREAVRSVLAQELDEGEVEVVIALSDAESAEDRAAAAELAAADPRVAVAVARRLGPAAARNAAMAVAAGGALAFMDDDCIAQPGWLRAGLRRLREVDMVQGRTLPADQHTEVPWAYTIAVHRLSYLWETCNLLVRRDAAARAGGFDEEWNPRRRPGTHWGEDTEWGWRVVRAGATYAFEPEALVLHAVFPRTYAQWLEYKLRVRFMPLFVREIPEVRRHFVAGYFANRAHARMAAAAGCLGAAAVAGLCGRRTAAEALVVAAALPALRPARWHVYRAAEDLLAVGAALYGSVRYRRLVV